jgi:hypothetical protein
MKIKAKWLPFGKKDKIIYVVLRRWWQIMAPFPWKFRFVFPEELRRLGVVGISAGLLAVAVIYSREEHVAAEEQQFQHAKEHQQAEGWFIPTPKVVEVPVDKQESVASALPLPRPRPNTLEFYYELVRAQGDGEEGEYVLVRRKCSPNIDMPEPCYLPERERHKFPLRRE